MALLVTNNEGEGNAVATTLNTTLATVNRRGTFLATVGWNRSFYVGEKDALCASMTMQRTSTSATGAAATADRSPLTIFDAAHKVIAQLTTTRASNALWQVYLGTYDPSGVWNSQLVQLMVDASFNVETRFDLKVSYNPTGTIMTVTAFVNGSRIHVTTFNASTAGVGRPCSGLWGMPASTLPNNAIEFYVWNLLVDDASTVGLALTALQGSSGGFYTAADGTYVSVSELGVDLTNGLTFNAVGDKESWIVTPLAGKDYTGSAIGAVIVTYLASKAAGSAIAELQAFVRISGTDYDVGPSSVITDETIPYTINIPLNPGTGLSWTGGELTAGIEFGLRAAA